MFRKTGRGALDQYKPEDFLTILLHAALEPSALSGIPAPSPWRRRAAAGLQERNLEIQSLVSGILSGNGLNGWNPEESYVSPMAACGQGGILPVVLTSSLLSVIGDRPGYAEAAGTQNAPLLQSWENRGYSRVISLESLTGELRGRMKHVPVPETGILAWFGRSGGRGVVQKLQGLVRPRSTVSQEFMERRDVLGFLLYSALNPETLRRPVRKAEDCLSLLSGAELVFMDLPPRLEEGAEPCCSPVRMILAAFYLRECREALDAVSRNPAPLLPDGSDRASATGCAGLAGEIFYRLAAAWKRHYGLLGDLGTHVRVLTERADGLCPRPAIILADYREKPAA
ncbi:MAG: hypothetical protein M3O22_08110 [Pseudomonadota bacterium]|nr:hypothetical protein [Pseudomonadota bacterium]